MNLFSGDCNPIISFGNVSSRGLINPEQRRGDKQPRAAFGRRWKLPSLKSNRSEDEDRYLTCCTPS